MLLTNDDGVSAPGLHAVALALATAQDVDVDVMVAAPLKNCSATAQHITIATPLEVSAASVPHAAEALAVHGYPADCVMLMLSAGSEVLPKWRAPALVVSGINRGSNAGRNVYYSGTLAAAREAALRGVPAVALSVDSYSGKYDYGPAAQAALPVLRAALASAVGGTFPAEALINVNIPASFVDERPPVYAPARVGKDMVFAGYKLVSEEGGVRAFAQTNVHVEEDNTYATDGAALRQGLVAVSVLPLALDEAAVEPALLEIARAANADAQQARDKDKDLAASL